MKIILTDNFGRETIRERLLYEHLHPWIAQWMLAEIRRPFEDVFNSDYYPIVVEDDYRLWRGMEDLV